MRIDRVLVVVLSYALKGRPENVPSKADTEVDCSKGFIFIDNKNNKIKSKIVLPKYENNIETCHILLKANKNYRLCANVSYLPNYPSDCEKRFLHIGNDKYRPNIVSMTSYKYCNQAVSQEIVSRKNFLWIIYSVTGNLTGLQVSVSALEEATCSERQFECSPIQCVEKEKVCDDIIDCDNGRDEYCVLDKDATDPDQPCFRCADDTCIRPTLPRYHDDWGKPLWYLCDNITHCRDGTDERSDVCKTNSGRRDKVITCLPARHPEVMWKADTVCSGKNDHCDDEAECNNKGEESGGNVLFIPILIVAIAVIVVAMAFCIIHKKILLMTKSPPPDHSVNTPAEESVSPVYTRRPQYRFNICQGGRPSLDTLPEEKQCFITTV